MTMSLISTITVGSNSPTTIDFTNIPSIYSDLYIMVSARFNTGSSDLKMSLNGSSTGFVSKYIYGTGAGPTASASTTTNYIGKTCSTGDTANQFGSTEIYISNYTSAYNKNINSKSVEETNATGGVQTIFGTTWTSNSAITSISFYDYGGTAAFVQNSVISLYGINRTQGQGSPKAIGGVISYANNRWFHTFTSSGTFTAKQPLVADCLVVGAGGGGGAYDAGGGGAGGYQTTSATLDATSYSVTIGAGGPGGIYYSPGRNGAPSNFLTKTSIGGGGGGSAMTYPGAGENGSLGASGGGARGGRNGGNSGGSGTAGQGFAGGGSSGSSGYGAGGGGGAGGAGGNGATNANGSGGAGLQWINGSYYAGGGGGCVVTAYGIGTPGAGGIGGGGAGGTPPVAGTANTGGGGGGNRDSTPGAAGGSGVVIISYPAN